MLLGTKTAQDQAPSTWAVYRLSSPLLMLVSDLARFPADTAVFNILATTFPADPSFSVPWR